MSVFYENIADASASDMSVQEGDFASWRQDRMLTGN